MKLLVADEVAGHALADLGLRSTEHDLETVEAVACLLRRSASLLCPCPPRLLMNKVADSLRGLIADAEAASELIEDTLEAMTAYGDLVECARGCSTDKEATTPLLYLSPPAFIARQSGAILLMGLVPDHPSVLPPELQAHVNYIRHIRRLPRGENPADLVGELLDLGLVELPEKVWLKAPSPSSASHLIHQHDGLLDQMRLSGEMPGLEILDSTKPVRYYRGRWSAPKAEHQGRFVGRRRQPYGADLWCYVQLESGHPVRFFDFPVAQAKWRGCDEAWYLQFALDFERGQPQQYRLCTNETEPGTTIAQFFSPVPMWAKRRWDALGEPVVLPGCLFAYSFPESEVPEEVRFIENQLWMAAVPESSKT